jgi:hypothetical protein
MSTQMIWFSSPRTVSARLRSPLECSSISRLEQADGEGDAGRLDRLQVDRRQQGRDQLLQSRPADRPSTAPRAIGSGALHRSATVGAAAVMSKTPSWRTATTLGPAVVLTRPISVPAKPSSGRISATGRLRRFVARKVRHSLEH